MIDVQYETTAADWQAFQQHAIASVHGSAGVAASGLSWRSLAVGIPIGIVLAIGGRLLAFSFHLPTAAVVVVIVLLFWGYFRWKIASAFTPTAGGAIVGPRQISLDENAVTEESANHRHESRWSGITSVEETHEHVFLMVDRFAGYIVPKRAFPDSFSRNAFLSFARAHAGSKDGGSKAS
jgi:YcxB-like protein